MKNLLLFLLGSLPYFLHAQQAPATAQPNILMIVVDDMGWHDVGYHGSEIQTPTLDRLARVGLELDRFYVHATCSPTRASLLTGRSASRLGMLNPLSKNNELGLPLSEKLMPQFFKDAGYETYLVGKWHLGRFKKEYWPLNRGFDHFYGFLNGGIGHYDHVHGGGLDWQRNGKTLEEKGYSTHLLTHEAINLISAKDSLRPFFLMLCFAAPHSPNEAPDTAMAPYQHLPNPHRKAYAGMVSEVDQGVRRILETLESQDLIDNTLIWFMSDNGGRNYASTPPTIKHNVERLTNILGAPLPIPFFEFFRKSMEKGAGDNHPFKGGKYLVQEGGIRVPSFVYAPGYLSGRKIESRITVHDVLPTLAGMAGLATDSTVFDGTNHWSFFQEKTEARIPPFLTESKFGSAYFQEEWKLIQTTGEPDELYQIFEDPLESHNLAESYPSVVAQLSQAIQTFPRGKAIDDPLWKVFIDPDRFGGEIDREPYAGVEGKVAGPIHASTYILIFLFLLLLSLLILGFRQGWRWMKRMRKK
ncbi:MAG: arylsulfatase [Bacteroidota bacterium]